MNDKAEQIEEVMQDADENEADTEVWKCPALPA